MQQVKERMRSDHLTFKDPGVSNDPSLRTSVAHSHFDYKGNAMEIR